MSKVQHYVSRTGDGTYETKLISEKQSHFGEKLADDSFIRAVMSHLLGKILTTVEATTPSDKQAKAIKDLVRGHFLEEFGFVSQFLFDQEMCQEFANKQAEKMSDEELHESAMEIDDVLKS